MKVKLLKYADDIRLWNENVACKAAALCLDKLNTASTKNMEAAINSGHYSILEHLPLTFLVEDISRACSHQLIRHRHFSFSQMSQRYVKVNTDEKWYIVPKSISEKDDKEIIALQRKEFPYGTSITHYYELFMNDIAKFYQRMIDEGIPKEDARFILPNACHTSIIISMNARAFSEACTLRTCNKAQWEIRELFIKMRELVKDVYPHIFKLCFPNCCKKQGCLESKSCNDPVSKRLINQHN